MSPTRFFKTLWSFIIASLKFAFNKGFKRCPSNASLQGKTVIITGSNRGIGAHTAYDLAKRGAKVILACRNIDLAKKVAQDITKRTGNPQVETLFLDLTSFASIRQFADQINSTQDRVNILIHNAGVFFGEPERSLTEDGFEQQFQVNHLGPVLLTKLLLPLIKKSAPSRIIFVSSTAHHFMFTIDLDNLNGDKYYHPSLAYGKSKLANILATQYLASQLKDSRVTVNSLCPGLVDTDMVRGHSLMSTLGFFFTPFLNLFALSAEQGSQTLIYCAVEKSLDRVSGKYFQFCKAIKPSKSAQDFALAKSCWERCEEMIKTAS